MNGYLSVAKAYERETVIEKSRFICGIIPCDDEATAREFLEKTKKAHPFASHNCYAYIVENGEAARFSDDGEPQGTAGKPILDAMKAKGIINAAVVVTRYFGGIKLGAGGLIRAYFGAAAEAIDEAGTKEFMLSDEVTVSFSYDKYQGFLRFKEPFTHKIISQDFADQITVKLFIPSLTARDFTEKLNDFFAGKAAISRLSGDFVAYGG